ncbi:MAG: YqgE/AlgH family protein [Cyclobacteriaceae bacterium]
MDYFNISNQQKPTTGDVLISNPMMGDPNFERSIIYLCEHSNEGSLGLVLNKPSKVSLDEVIDDIESDEVPLFVGGPVEQNTLHYIYSVNTDSIIKKPLEGAKKISGDIYMGGDFDELKDIYLTLPFNTSHVKFFVGYSGWSEGQLQKEIEDNSWVVVKDPPASDIFNSSSRIHWKDMMTELGGRYKMMSNYPVDPRLN